MKVDQMLELSASDFRLKVKSFEKQSTLLGSVLFCICFLLHACRLQPCSLLFPNKQAKDDVCLMFKVHYIYFRRSTFEHDDVCNDTDKVTLESVKKDYVFPIRMSRFLLINAWYNNEEAGRLFYYRSVGQDLIHKIAS